MSGRDGGAAFPGFNYVSSNVHDGMTLLDYFAGAALPGLIGLGNPSDIAETAYRIADAMLAQRDK